MTKHEKQMEKLMEIDASHINGQKKQMVNQIKAYGVKRFFVDYHDVYLKTLYRDDFHYAYSKVVYTYFLLTS